MEVFILPWLVVMGFEVCCRLMQWFECFCPPQNLYVELLEVGVLCKFIHEGEALMNGINVLIRETPLRPLAPLTVGGLSKRYCL